MVESCTSAVGHIAAGNLCLHNREVRVLGAEILIEAQRSCKVDGILKGHITVITTSQNFNHLTLLALMQYIEASVLVFAQILNQTLAEHIGLVHVCVLILAFTDLCEALCSSIETHKFTKFVRRLEVQVYFVREVLHTTDVFVIRRHDMDIEITLRLGSAALSRQAHKQVTFTENAMRIPVQVIFVNIEVGNILLCVPL